MKRVLVISASPRVRSNSDALANEFIRGAKEAGHEVEKVPIREKNIHITASPRKDSNSKQLAQWFQEEAERLGADNT